MAEVYPSGSPPDSPRRTFAAWFGDTWCRLFHRRVMMPIHGYYQCRSCFRRIPVELDTEHREDPSSPKQP